MGHAELSISMNYHNVFTPVQHMRRPEVHPGGLCWVIFCKWEDVMVWPEIDPQTGIVNTTFQLFPGKTWYNLQVTFKGRLYNEIPKRSNAGPYWEMQVTGYFGGSNSNHTLSAFASRFHQYVVMFKDLDGEIRFIGNQDSGAEIESPYGSGDKDASRKRSITFGWEHANPAQIFQGNANGILTDIITAPFIRLGDFTDDFNPDYNI
jgi:hypothetical protein